MVKDKQNLVLLPGLLCDAALWHHQSTYLAELANITIADFTRDDSITGMAEAALATAPERFALTGLSMGGYVAQEIMRRAPPDAAYDEPCDIFVPCAVGGVLNKENIPSLKCQAVAGAANNQLGNPEDAIRLRDRAILYVPDFIANSGGAIAVIGMEMSGWSQEEAEKRVIQTIRENLSNIFELS